MNRERWQRVDQVCSEVLGMPPTERAAALDRLCAGDEELRLEVERLLGEEAHAEALLDVPAWQAAAAEFLSDDSDSPLALPPGHRLGPYEIEALVGVGGMGEVYRARDTRLDRMVAIKVLWQGPVDGGSDRQQFLREARAVSALNHPNVCSLFDVGTDGAVDFLVMEYLEGQTLADRLRLDGGGEEAEPRPSPLPLAETLRIARGVADGLAAAHRVGIIHGDLKPANVMLTRTGAKLLDFGVARRRLAGAATTGVAAAGSLASGVDGAVIGTASYMAPEQLGGREPDTRSDLFAFGALLYEMLTGHRLFCGSSPAGTIASILSADAPDLALLPAAIPPGLRRLVTGCLQKDPDRRWDSAHLASDELARLLGEPDRLDNLGVADEAKSRWWRRPMWAVAGLGVVVVLLVLGAAALRRQGAGPSDRPVTVRRLNLDLGEGFSRHPRGESELSPDGRHIVFWASDGSQRMHLYGRTLDDLSSEASVLFSGSLGYPFYSPDSTWVAFFSGEQLLKVSPAGGPVVEIARASEAVARGGSWGDDGRIVAALNTTGGLSRIKASGGQWEPLTRVEGTATHRWPQVLPGSKAVIFTASPVAGRFDGANIEALVLATGERKVLWRGGYYGRYVETGHLVFVRHHTLFAVPMDLKTLEVRGTPVPIVNQVAADSELGLLKFSSSRDGRALCLTGSWEPAPSTLIWRDRSGASEQIPLAAARYADPRVSPDGRRICYSLRQGTQLQLVVLENGVPSRLVSDSVDVGPVWAPDSEHLAYASDAGGGTLNVMWRRADGSGPVQRIVRSPNLQYPSSFSADGRLLAYVDFDPVTSEDVWLLPLDLTDPDRPVPGVARPLARTTASEGDPAVSPDGRWVAYTSEDAGRRQIFIRAVNGPGEVRQVTRGGGTMPIWSQGGRQIVYRSASRMMAVDVTTRGAALVIGEPYSWASWELARNAEVDITRPFDISRDGRRALVLGPAVGSPRRPSLTLFLDFFEELRAASPGK